MDACYVVLAHVTWALAIRAAEIVTWVLTGSGGLSGTLQYNTNFHDCILF